MTELTKTEHELVERARKKPMAEWTEDERAAVKRALDRDDAIGDDDPTPPERACDDCGQVYGGDVQQAPMLMDATWRKLAGKWEHLCEGCLQARAGRLGLKITLVDLRPCQFNVGAGWFEVYADQAPPEVVVDWLKWARRKHETDTSRWAQYMSESERIYRDGKPNADARVMRLWRKIYRGEE